MLAERKREIWMSVTRGAWIQQQSRRSVRSRSGKIEKIVVCESTSLFFSSAVAVMTDSHMSVVMSVYNIDRHYVSQTFFVFYGVQYIIKL